MTLHNVEIPFTPDWPAPAPRFLNAELPPPPDLPLADVFGEAWARWIKTAAEAKSAPPDYLVASLLAVTGTTIGNTRWVSPWQGWTEPPILWAMAVGLPSSGKSPGLDAVLSPLKQIEREMRQATDAELAEWRERADLAKLAEAAWKEDAKAALKAGEEPPERPKTANPGEEPFAPRLLITDGTVERLAVIVARQPRGSLMARDELSGWLQGMTRYAGGGSDRPFWLEAYGGRGYTVERMGRDPVHIDRLSLGVVGGIQPDRLKGLLFTSDDDGLLARFMPIWPDPVPIRRPRDTLDHAFLERALKRLLSLQMLTDERDITRPWITPFSEEARDLLDAFRHTVRSWENEAEGLLMSFTGKLPGLAVRLSLVLAYLDWAVQMKEEPHEITVAHMGRAAHFIEAYVLPMARRAYADAALSKPERAARRLVALIRDHGWTGFSTREVLRLGRTGLSTVAELNPALTALEEAEILRPASGPAVVQSGRPPRLYAVNPAVLREGP